MRMEQNTDLVTNSIVPYGIMEMNFVNKKTTKQIKHRKAYLLYAGLHNDLMIYYNSR